MNKPSDKNPLVRLPISLRKWSSSILSARMKPSFFCQLFLFALTLFCDNSNACITLNQVGSDLVINVSQPVEFRVTRDVNSSRYGFTLPGAIDVAGTGGFQLSFDLATAPSITDPNLSATTPGVGLIRGGPDLEILYFLPSNVFLNTGDAVTLNIGTISLPGFFNFSIINGINYSTASNVILSESSGSHISGLTPTGLTIPNDAFVDGGADFSLCGNLTTGAGSTFSVTGASSVGSATNDGTITMQDGNVGDTLSIAGDYTGSGSLVLDTDFANATSDKLIVDGDVTGGPTEILVAGDISGNYQPGTEIVLVEVDGTTNAGDFTMETQSISDGVYDYDLGLMLDNSNWLLNSSNVALNWSAGTLNQDFSGEMGSDVANIYSGAEYTGSEVIDGGDDVSTADGLVDTLTLHGVTVSTPGANLPNWENIIVNGGSVTFTDSQLVTGSEAGRGLTITGGGTVDGGTDFALTGNVTTDAGATLSANGASTVSGNATNSGTINMQDGNAGDTLSVAGDYVGGGGLLLDTDFVNGVSDHLIIAGDVTGDPTEIMLNGDPTNYDGGNIVLVHVDGATSEGDFYLTNNSPFDYDFDFSLSDSDWLLSAENRRLNITGGTYAAAPQALLGFTEMPTLRQRMHDRFVFGRYNNSQHADAYGEASKTSNFWVTHKSDRWETTTSNDTRLERSMSEFYFGTDSVAKEGKGGQWIYGVVGHYQNQGMDVSMDTGTGEIDSTGFGITATATWYGDSKLYFDAQAKMSSIKSDMSSSRDGELVSGHSSRATTLSVEVGKQFQLEGHNFTPQAQLIYGNASGGNFTDKQGYAVGLGSNKQTLGRLGFLYEVSKTSGGTEGAGLYLLGNVLHNFSNESTVNVAGIDVVSEIPKTWGELSIGGSFSLNKNINLHGELSYRKAFSEVSSSDSNSSDSNGLRIDTGVKIYW